MPNFDAIVGLDLSLTSTGIAKYDAAGVTIDRIRSKGAKDATWNARRDRLVHLADEITSRSGSHALIMIEAPSYASAVSASAHDRSGMWWFVFDQLHRQGCTIVPVAPTQRMKYATGVGGGPKASKDAVLAAAVRRYPAIDITGNDIADAVLLMAMGSRLLGRPVEDNLPKTHIDALAKLALPQLVSA